MDPSEDLDQLLRVRIAHADYVMARGRAVGISVLDAAGGIAFAGELREVGPLARPVPGFEAFWLAFAIRDRAPAQALYRVTIDGLPAHALLRVPSARHGEVTEYHASFSREDS
jgi:hypothetical protein